VEGKIVGIRVPSLWFEYSAVVIYKNHKTGSERFKRERFCISSLSGRLVVSREKYQGMLKKY